MGVEAGMGGRWREGAGGGVISGEAGVVNEG